MDQEAGADDREDNEPERELEDDRSITTEPVVRDAPAIEERDLK